MAAFEVITEAMDVLLHYPWPGNIRELQNIIERAVILTSGDVLRLSPLPTHAAFRTPNPLPWQMRNAITF
jgi:DNA-binding NtrC family response regulator